MLSTDLSSVDAKKEESSIQKLEISLDFNV